MFGCRRAVVDDGPAVYTEVLSAAHHKTGAILTNTPLFLIIPHKICSSNIPKFFYFITGEPRYKIPPWDRPYNEGVHKLGSILDCVSRPSLTNGL
ncbi:unnamed protein product [Meloidogyne enterolobii]|uniref:Uncharacterized protein n=1 Tax=Meloidogyne enterolobii TaxID=390850 RepID=A0ACB0Y526_MELEN